MPKLPKPALLIAAHGSKVEGWAQRVQEFGRHVAESPSVAAAFAVVEVAFLENAKPSIPVAVQMALSSGCSEVIVVPFFVSVSAHAAEDVPGILGLDVPEHVRRRLLAEGHQPLPPGLPIRLAPLGGLRSLISRNVVRRTSLASKLRQREGVVLCAYGSTIHHEVWETLLGEVRESLLEAGFAAVNHAYVGHVVGLSPEPTAEAITACAKEANVDRVHVVPLLMARSRLQSHIIGAAVADVSDRLVEEVLYEGDAILPDGDLAAHVGVVGLAALGILTSSVDRVLA